MFSQSGSMEFPRSYNFSQELPAFGSQVPLGYASRAEGRWTRTAQWLGFALILSVLAGIALAIAVAILAVQNANTQEQLKMEQPCTDRICVQAAASIWDKMDTDVDPCENFYDYACGKWLKETGVPPTSTSWGQFEVLRDKLAVQLREILEEATEESRMVPPPFLMAQKFYESCIRTDAPQNATIDLVNTIERLVGNSDNFIVTNFTTILANIRREVDGHYIFSFDVDLDEKNSSRYALYIDQPRFGLSPTFLKDPGDNVYRSDYLILIATVWKYIFSIDESRAKIIAGDILRVEIALASISSTPEARSNRSLEYRGMTLDDLKNVTKDEKALDWDTYLNEVFGNDTTTFEALWHRSQNLSNISDAIQTGSTPIAGSTSNFTVVMGDQTYFQKLGSVLNVDYNGRDILNYLKWRLILDLGSESSEGLQSILFEYVKATQGLLLPVPKWRSCIETTNLLLGPAVSYRYVKKHFAQKYVDEADMLVKDLRSAFVKILSNLDWLDEKTRQVALGKIDKMKTFVGFSKRLTNPIFLNYYYQSLGNFKNPGNHFSNYIQLLEWHSREGLSKLFKEKDSTENWIVDPTVVNAFYSYLHNSINFPAGILQPPFFRMPMQALNYGAIGSIIGHEITHGFDDTGRQSDSEGNLVDWWDSGTSEAYMKKSECFVEQYGNYSVDFAGSLWHVNGNMTLSENIADNGGLRQAFEAYKLYTERSGVEGPLPGLAAFTPLQLFFVSFAQVWCGSYTDKNLQDRLMTGRHSPNKFRVQGALYNLDEFYSTWNCTRNHTGKVPGRPQTCRIW